MTQMQWNSGFNAYVGTLENGIEIRVDGDEYAECEQQMIADGQSESERGNALSAEAWREQVGINASVQVICALCGDDSAVPETTDHGLGTQCDCPCHDDGIARGRAD